MYKNKMNQPTNHLFTFTNSVKNSHKATPDASNNVSFQSGLSSAQKSLFSESFSVLRESNYPQLFNSNNKQNQQYRSINLSNQKYASNANFNHSSSKKNIAKKSASKSKLHLKEPLKLLENSPFNIKIDLTSSLSKNEDNSRLFKSVSILQSNKKERQSTIRQENIKVYIRLKPKAQKQLNSKDAIQVVSNTTVKIQDNYFCFDQIFQQHADQELLFNQVGAKMCQKLFQGYNGTIFAYGQTGSGKTYTIFGEEDQQNYGLIYRCIRKILSTHNEAKQNVKIKCSMVELYKQQLIDMFGIGTDLKLKENKQGSVYIEGLRQVYIKNENEMMNLVRKAAKSRKVTATNLNQESSRSHTILTIYLQFQKYTTKLCLIDLAGSEKVCKSGTKGEAFEETKKINTSLSCLGNVINALTTRNKSQHIPFRDSKLTRILKDSLTGNFITSIIVNCSTAEQSMNETISSLKFAERAKKIKVNVQSMQEQANQKQSFDHLHSIINKLKSQLQYTTEELNKYKKSDKPIQKQRQKIKCKINLHGTSNYPPLNGTNTNMLKKKSEQQDTNRNTQFDLTARNPIPSQRACVQQHINKYKAEKIINKPHYLMNLNNLNINQFSSLNVSKSIKKLGGQNSPDISSLSFNYDESPDLSLSFSIRGDTAQKQMLFNSPS